jgi:hypothetical protein
MVVRHSPHVVNLRGVIVVTEPIEPPNPYRGTLARLRKMFDCHVHRTDGHVRSLSVRTHGWRDFPPDEAATLAEALVITARRFVSGHPLSDLTVVSLLHFSVLAVWKIFIRPAERTVAICRTAALRRRIDKETVRRTTSPATALRLAAAKKGAADQKPNRRRPRPHLTFGLPRGWRTSLAGFAAMVALAVVPAGSYGMLMNGSSPFRDILNAGKSAAHDFVNAAAAAGTMDFAAASDDFREAEAGFTEAADSLGSLGRALSYAAAVLPTGTRLAAASPLIEAGREAAGAGAVVSDAMRRIKDNPDLPNTEKLRLLDSAIAVALPRFERAAAALASVPADAIPEEYRDRVLAAQTQAPRALALLRSADPALRLLMTVAGDDEPRRYLLLFQNDAELRPTGGFIGSFAVLDVRDGKIERLDIPAGGSYDLQGQQTLRLVSPQPLHLVNARWEFQDANWYPDFPTSARLISRFYEHAGGSTVDGIITVNSSVMKRLLRVVGPVEMPDYGKVIDAGNFALETQKAVELEYDKEANRPKQFLADLAPIVMGRLMQADTATASRLGREMMDALTGKEILVWLRRDDEARQVSRLGWDGSLKATGGDYLMVVHANIAGQKTDAVMSDRIGHSAKILPDGSAIVTVTLSRTHAGKKRALFTGVRNVDYVRFCVPAGAQLVEANGFTAPDPTYFEIPADDLEKDPALAEEEAGATHDRVSGMRTSIESGKTVFGNWLMTDPGETSMATITYRLPPGIIEITRPEPDVDKLPRLSYSFTWQKQSGADSTEATATVQLPSGWTVGGVSPEKSGGDASSVTWQSALDRDFSYSLSATGLPVSIQADGD